MKNLMIITALSLGFGSAYAQKVKEAEVPAAVKDGFKKQHPNAKVEKWEKEGADYEAEFEIKRVPMDDPKGKLQEVEMSELYDANGNLLETETEIKVSELPKTVSDYVTKNLAGKKIKEASKIVDSKGAVWYEAEVDETDYIFDSTGAFVKKEMDKEKDDDKKKKD